MMAAGPVRAATYAARAARGAALHASWWLRYRLDGHTRPAPPEPAARRQGGRGSAE
jgi:hypothetical protein